MAPWGWYLLGGIAEQPEKQETAERLTAQAWSQAAWGLMSTLRLLASLSPSSMTQRKCCPESDRASAQAPSPGSE